MKTARMERLIELDAWVVLVWLMGCRPHECRVVADSGEKVLNGRDKKKAAICSTPVSLDWK
jgi:hypothetical protein